MIWERLTDNEKYAVFQEHKHHGDQVEEELESLRNAVRKHRDYRGDDKCWQDDEELYAALPEGFTPPERDTEVELERCKQFIACRKNPKTIYVSPQRRIEELEEENRKLKDAYQKQRSTIVHQEELIGIAQINKLLIKLRDQKPEPNSDSSVT